MEGEEVELAAELAVVALLRLLQQRTVQLGIDVFMELTVTDLFQEDGRISGAFGYWRETGRFVLFEAPAVWSSLKAPSWPVDSRCPPRQRSSNEPWR